MNRGLRFVEELAAAYAPFVAQTAQVVGDVKMDGDVEDLGGSLCVQWKYSIPAYPSHFFSLQKNTKTRFVGLCWI